MIDIATSFHLQQPPHPPPPPNGILRISPLPPAFLLLLLLLLLLVHDGERVGAQWQTVSLWCLSDVTSNCHGALCTNLMLAVGMRDSFCIPGESSSLGRICILPALSQHGDPVWPSLFGPQFEWSKMQKGMAVRCRYRCRCNPRLSKQRLVHVCWGVGAATFWNFECWHSQFGFLWPSMDIRAFDVVLS